MMELFLKLFLYRLSLTEAAQLDLFEPQSAIGRKEFLLSQFKKSFAFDYRKDIKLRYSFIQEEAGIIYAALCRWTPEDAETDPSDPFVVSEGGRWRKATFLLNINDDEQVVGVESVVGVGLPNSILGGLIETINAESLGEPFRIDAFALPTSGSFNSAVGSYPGPITAIQFDLVVPNPIDAEGETKEALKRLRERTGADRIGEKLQSENGLNTAGDYIQSVVDYAEKGGGNVSAKSDGEIVYDSKNSVRSATVPDELRPAGTTIAYLFSIVEHIFGR